MWFRKNTPAVSAEIKYPDHIAIIMDGNGRWAKKRNMPRTFGHKVGVDVAERIIDHAIDVGLPHLSLYAFSTENWKRPEEEVATLMDLFDVYADRVIKRYYADDEGRYKSTHIRFLGDVSVLRGSIRKKIDTIEELNKERVPKTTVNIAVNYGGRSEIVSALNEFIRENPGKEISEEAISERLYFRGEPDPDLIIRTGGEMRLSNFMLWEAAYSEFYSTQTFWPDFTPEEFDKAVEAFGKRTRRFGGV